MKDSIGLMVLAIDSGPDVGKRDCFDLVGTPLRSESRYDGAIEGTSMAIAGGSSVLVDIATEGIRVGISVSALIVSSIVRPVGIRVTGDVGVPDGEADSTRVGMPVDD